MKFLAEMRPFRKRALSAARVLGLAGLLGGFVLADRAAGQTFQVSSVGTLTNDQTSIAMGIDNAGTIVGNSFDAYGSSHAFTLQGQTQTALTGLGGTTSEANGISSNGEIVGSAALASGVTHACVWVSGAPTDVDPSNTYGPSQGTSSNASGVMTGYYLNSSNQPQGFTFNGTTLSTVNYPSATQTTVNAINDLGEWAGSYTGSSTMNAFVWNGTTYQSLPNASGGTEGEANAINQAGDVAGWVTNSSGLEQAALWRNGALILLGDLGGNYGEATALNNYGQVVGTSNIAASSYQPVYTANGQTSGYESAGTLQPMVDSLAHAFLWENGTFIDLNTLLPANSGWILQCATGINDSGAIVGYGTLNGVLTGFLLSPKAPTPTAGAGTLSLSQSSYSVNKNDGTVTITVTRTGGTTGAVSAQIATAPGTAQAGVNFTPVYTTVSFANGQGGSQTVTIPVADDSSVVTNQNLSVQLFAVSGGAAQGTTTSATVTVVAPPFDLWRSQNFTTAQLSNTAISGPTATPAGDGVPNLLKYALGLNPNTPVPSNVVNVGLNSTQTALQLSYTAMTSATDVSLVVQVSSDLVNWSSGSTATTQVSSVNNGNSQTVTVMSNTPFSSAQKQFMRLQVTRLP